MPRLLSPSGTPINATVTPLSGTNTCTPPLVTVSQALCHWLDGTGGVVGTARVGVGSPLCTAGTVLECVGTLLYVTNLVLCYCWQPSACTWHCFCLLLAAFYTAGTGVVTVGIPL